MLKISFLLTVICLISGALYSCNQTKNKSELSKLIKEDAVLVDVRSSEEFAEGSVDGAINIPVDILQDNIEKFPADKPIIVFCKSGNRAEKARKILEENNILDVVNGGSWQNVKKALDEAKTTVESGKNKETME